MARKSWEALSPGHRHRLERGGITPEMHAAGVSLQSARGHKPGEHRPHATKSGLQSLSSADRAFLARQEQRSGKDDYSRERAYFKKLTPSQRALHRERVANEAKEFRRRKHKIKRSLAEYRDELAEAGLIRYDADFPDFDDIQTLFFYH